MNKAIMIAIQPKWLQMIINCEKEFEFRNYPIAQGTKVYLYESKGKRKLCPDCDGSCEVHVLMPNGYDERACYNCELGYIYEGKGAVVAEFVVDECYECWETLDEKLVHLKPNDNSYIKLEVSGKKTLEKIGYNEQNYAMKIKDLIVYDEKWLIEELWNEGNHLQYGGEEWFDKVPTSPIAVTEFVKYNDGKNMTTNPQGKVYVYEKL